MRIPRLMATQHPDASVKVAVSEEVREALDAYRVYGCDEVMVDYEGKLTPYSQPREIVQAAVEEGLPVGKRFFVTVRAPNPRLEGLDRFMLALESAVLANYYSRTLAGEDAVRWVIVPMVDSADVLRLAAEVLEAKARLVARVSGVEVGVPQVVPLFEGVQEHLSAASVVSSYADYLESKGGTELIRVFIGKSDAALRGGHIASMLSVKYAMLRLKELSRERGVRISVIVGMGSPPFRGGLNNPILAELEAGFYSGFDTATLQSAVRYDVPREEGVKVARLLVEASGKGVEPLEVDEAVIVELSERYKRLVSGVLPAVITAADRVPQTRDRLDRRLYGRIIVDGHSPAPRAIAFTAACYSLGFPPTLFDAEGLLAGALDELPSRAVSLLKQELEFDFSFFDAETAGASIGRRPVELALRLREELGIDAHPREDYVSRLRSGASHVELARMRGFLG